MKKLLTLLIVIAAVIALYWFCKPLIAKVFAEKIITQYSTQAIRMGDLRRTIESTGTVEPEELVNVGAQIGGMVISFGKDADGKTVDYGSKVKAGTLLAQIDDSLYLAERDIARANCAQGEASIASAKASLEEAQAQYNLAESDWKRISVFFWLPRILSGIFYTGVTNNLVKEFHHIIIVRTTNTAYSHNLAIF